MANVKNNTGEWDVNCKYVALWTSRWLSHLSKICLSLEHSVASLSLFTFMHWRRKWQPTPVSLPGESQGRGSLVGWRLWGRTEWDTTDAASQQQQQQSAVLLVGVGLGQGW